MAASFQQQSRVRKLTYAGLILVLLTGSMLYRKLGIEPQAFALQLRAETQGEVELTSSAVRLALLGSRGLATTILWQLSAEKMKRHQWNELELLVTSITKLQPNFVTPWMFQGWNLAYNVAVECDQPRDKYFYIARGTQLLAEGERRHQGAAVVTRGGESIRFPGNPDMRLSIGDFFKMKIGTSDEKNVMKCLFDLSCIDPKEWDPERFKTYDAEGMPVVNKAEFERFCIQHPRLVRRLREKLYCSTPDDVIAFLSNNRGIPSRFTEGQLDAENRTALAEPSKQFPILPLHGEKVDLPDPAVERFEHPKAPDFDCFLACYCWFKYAQEPLPPLPEEPYMGYGAPNYNAPEYRLKYRLPKMTTEIFRAYPARAREYYADNREKGEGWFNSDGWEITGWFDDLGKVVRVGDSVKYHAAPAWEVAYQEYKGYGERTGQLLPQENEKLLWEQANYFRQKYQIAQDQFPPPITPQQAAEDDGLLGKGHAAQFKLVWQGRVLALTNFEAHFDLCSVERLPEVADVRAALYGAKKLKDATNLEAARPQYRSALARWLSILAANPRFNQLDEIQIDTYENQWHYLDLEQDKHRAMLAGLIKGTMALGQENPLMATPLRLPLLEIVRKASPTVDKKLVPLRRPKGPLEQIYLPAGSEPRDLLALADWLRQGLAIGPALPNPTPQMLGLTQAIATTALDYGSLVSGDVFALTIPSTNSLSKDWRPLLHPDIVQQARFQMKLDRQVRPKGPPMMQ